MGRGMGRQTSGMSSGRRAWVDAVVGTSGEVCGEADGRRARARARPSGLARTEKMRGAGRDAERRGGADDEHPYAPRRGHHQPPVARNTESSSICSGVISSACRRPSFGLTGAPDAPPVVPLRRRAGVSPKPRRSASRAARVVVNIARRVSAATTNDGAAEGNSVMARGRHRSSNQRAAR